jgi:hypothetical protein
LEIKSHYSLFLIPDSCKLYIPLPVAGAPFGSVGLIDGDGDVDGLTDVVGDGLIVLVGDDVCANATDAASAAVVKNTPVPSATFLIINSPPFASP